MPKETNRSLMLAAKKVASIATMASMLSSMLNLGLILPVKAQIQYTEAANWLDSGAYFRTIDTANNQLTDIGAANSTSTLASLTSFINMPTTSGVNGPEYTNVSYTFAPTNNLTIGMAGGFIKIATNIPDLLSQQDPAERESWLSAWVQSMDPALFPNSYAAAVASNIVATDLAAYGISVATATFVDGNNDGNTNTLSLNLVCDMGNFPNGCVIPANTPINIDLKNDPLVRPTIAGPHRQLFVIGNKVVNGDIITEVGEGKMNINSYYGGLTVSASVDARLTFLVTGENAGATLGALTSTDDSSASGCDFGTLVPNTPEICIWTLNGSTNAANGMQVYVVQDQNMTYPGSGQSISQFFDGTQTLYSAAPQTGWSSPSTADAHLGYTSDDADVFDAVALGEQPFAGITTMSGAGVGAATANTAKVADTNTAGELSAKYANKIETTTRLEQAPDSLGQSYGHTQYFVVVGNF